jgi:hypothetical protein
MENKSQQENWEQIQKSNLKKARTNAIVFGIITGVALISITYAIVQKSIADENLILVERNMRETQELRIKLDQCAEAARMQAESAREAHIRCEEALQKALKK